MQKVQVVKIEMIKEKEVEIKEKRITRPQLAKDLFDEYIKNPDREYFVEITLDSGNYVTSITTVAIGSINSAIIHPREVFKTAILSNAVSIIVCHNHPSGDIKPSEEDVLVTKRLEKSGKILGIKLLDHIIIGDNGKYYSFCNEGNL